MAVVVCDVFLYYSQTYAHRSQKAILRIFEIERTKVEGRVAALVAKSALAISLESTPAIKQCVVRAVILEITTASNNVSFPPSFHGI